MKSRMNWRWPLFIFRGRIDRFSYWRMAAIHALVVIFGLAALSQVHLNGASPAVSLAVVLSVVIIGLVIPALAIGAKRLHDRDKSAWWLLLFYVVPDVLFGVGIYADIASEVAAHCMFAAFSGRTCPGSWTATVCVAAALAIEIWTLVELGGLRGSVGTNRFGPEPAQSQEPADVYEHDPFGS